MKITTKPKVWGNSLGVIIPKDLANREKISPETTITIEIRKENPIMEVFGSLKGWNLDAQKFKDEMRKEEFESEQRKWKQHIS